MIAAGVLLIVGALVARQRMMSEYRAQSAEANEQAETDRDELDTERDVPDDARDDREFDTAASSSDSDRSSDGYIFDGSDDVARGEGPATTDNVADQAPAELESQPLAPTEAPARQADEAPKLPAPKPVVTAPPVIVAPPVADAERPTLVITLPRKKPEAPESGSTDTPDSPATPAAANSSTPDAGSEPMPFKDLPASHVLAPPPRLRTRSSDVPLMDWLRYYSDGNAWSGVIQSISDRISGDVMLQPWFGSMDRSTLQRHVMATVRDLTSEGLTVGTVRELAAAQLAFVQAGGEPITEPVWEKLHATFANALREHLVPEAGVQSLDTTLAPLKAVIVKRSLI
ncbi:hypothetical protein N803_13985 [Knoellia subterranea KCTC 19937]|uniref:Uncharacterized protein n=2 Tax=Knoellia TaxID=136099 RepID=A0A0A0JLG7_9MICO|nr:hypothetical protein N803_13985 [Knoellia subterranea KCTC 19937]